MATVRLWPTADIRGLPANETELAWRMQPRGELIDFTKDGIATRQVQAVSELGFGEHLHYFW